MGKADKQTEAANRQATDHDIDHGIEGGMIDSAASPTKPDQQTPATSTHGSRIRLFFLIILLLAAASAAGLTLTEQWQAFYTRIMPGTHSQPPATVSQQPSGSTQSINTPSPALQPATLQHPASRESSPAQAYTPQAQSHPSIGSPTVAADNSPADSATGREADKAGQAATLPPASETGTAIIPTMTNDRIALLLNSIDTLRGEIQQLTSSQHDLQSALLEQQQMNLQIRLRWIVEPGSRLAQIQQAWEEISLLPGLSAAQRQRAVEMHTLARNNVLLLKQWQAALQQWADALSTPAHQNILPRPKQAWLAWIVDQFQLRQAPGQEAHRLSSLRNRLLETARQLTLESWPARSAWQSLHAELLLQIKRMPTEQSNISTGLPVDFSAIARDIHLLRQTARQWEQNAAPGDLL